MKYAMIIPALFFMAVLTTQVHAQNTNQQQPQPAPEYPMQKNSESQTQEPNTDKNPPLTPEQKAHKQADHLQKKLGLTEEQKLKVYDLNYARITQTKVAREKHKNSTDKQAGRTEMQKIKTDFDKGIIGVLNVDQQKTWEQLKSDARTKRAAHRSQQKGKGHKQPQPTEDDPENLDID